MSIPVALYPFTSELLPIVKYFNKLQNKYSLSKLAAPSGLSLTGRDAAHARNHQNTGFIVSDVLDMQDPSWSELFLINSQKITKNLPDANESLLKRALDAGKSVLYFDAGMKKPSVAVKEDTILKDHAWHMDLPTPTKWLRPGRYNSASVALVLVGGLVEEADVLDAVLGLAYEMRKDNLRPVVFTNHPLCGIFDSYNFDHIFNNNALSEAEKIQSLNEFIYGIEQLKRPGAIIVEAPDAVMRFSDAAPNGFGIRTYMLCQAMPPDCFICCAPLDLANAETLNGLNLVFTYRFNTQISYVHVSNAIFDNTAIAYANEISCVYTSLDMVREQIDKETAQLSIPLFDIVSDGIKPLYAHIRDNL